MGKMDERILVVNRYDFFENNYFAFQGLETNKRVVNYLMKKFKKYTVMRRGDAEKNPEYKQPIPSVILRRGDEVFVYKRLKAGGEARLHDQLSITVGGHMNRLNDVRNWDVNLTLNMHRELEEEVNIENCLYGEPELIGLINDDENEVGQVHIGILYVLDLPDHAEVTVKETNKLEGYWIRTRDLTKTPLFESLESWSQFAVEVL